MAPSDKPNVIVVMCDQLRAFEVGCYGNDVIRTPNMDRMAEEGVRFELAVSNNPVCTPGRSCLLSGQYTRTCMPYLGNPISMDEFGKPICTPWPVREREHLPDPTMPDAFREAGYDTAVIGKWHVHPAPDVIGFDYSLYPKVNHRHTGQTYVENGGKPFPVDGWSVDYEIENVEKFVSEDRDKPFFLFYSISPPHMPVADAPEEYKTMYSPDEVPLRANVFKDGEMAYNEEWFKIYLWDFLYYSQHLPYTMDLPEGFDLRKLTAMYYGMTTWVDDMLGKLFASLKANGRDENTIVVFTADHGDNLGSHQYFNKSRLIEESIRIPFILRAPGQFSHLENTTQVTQLIDIIPTLLDACGAEVPEQVQGRSLMPIISGECDALADNWCFIEDASREIGIRTPTHLCGMRLDNDERGIESEDDRFYDLRSDPYEMNNLGGSPEQAELAAELKGRLRSWHSETPYLAG